MGEGGSRPGLPQPGEAVEGDVRAGVADLILATEAELVSGWRAVGALEAVAEIQGLALTAAERANIAAVQDITRRFGELLAAGGLGR